MRPDPPRTAVTYGGAAVLAVLAVVATAALERTSGPTFFGLALIAVAATVWFGGLGPALISTAVTGIGMAVVLLEPVGSLSIPVRSAALRWWLFVAGALVITGLGHFMRSARERAEASERNLRMVSRASEGLETATDVSGRLRRLADALVPDLCDGCTVRVDGDGEEADHLLDAPAPALMRELSDEDAATLRACTGVEAPPESAIVAPLEARGARLGAMVLVTCRGRPRFGDDELAVATEIARRSALQVDNARLYESARAMSDSLARSDALKTALLRGVSHEFRTPLTAITAAADALERVAGDERGEMVRLIVEEADRLERLVANLLDLSRLDGGVLRPRIDECSAAELVAGARAATARFVPPGDVRVAIDASGPLVLADPVLGERIIVNLLLNAARHGAPPIQISAHEHPEEIEVVVADHGPGVPAALRESLFEQFAGSGTAGGLGLGLALSHRLAEASGARLALVDGAGGARFSLRLPRADRARAPAGRP